MREKIILMTYDYQFNHYMKRWEKANKKAKKTMNLKWLDKGLEYGRKCLIVSQERDKFIKKCKGLAK